MKTHIFSENELLTLAHKFDSGALAQIYDRYSPAIYRYAMRLIGSTQFAEECVAETFSRFLQSLHQGKGPREHLQAYLYRIAHNWIIDHYHREPVVGELSDEIQAVEAESPEDTAALHIRQTLLREAIMQLTPEQQQVIALKFLENCENDEIARILNKPVGAVKSLQHRALASLQRFLQEKELL